MNLAPPFAMAHPWVVLPHPFLCDAPTNRGRRSFFVRTARWMLLRRRYHVPMPEHERRY